MAAVELTISGVLYDKLNRTMQQVVLIGEASLTGLGIGGGPIYPSQPPGSPGVPTHPIMLPGMPGWGDPHPAHPIVLPDPPTDLPPGVQPDDDGFLKPPPPNGGWSMHKDYGWGYYPKPGQAGPK